MARHKLQAVLIFSPFLIVLSLASIRFDYSRQTQEDNDLELLCRNVSITGTHPIQDAKYYVNTTLMLGQELLSPSNHGLSYRITRDLEGNYSCGVDGSSSNEHVLLGKACIDTVHRIVSKV